MIQIREVRGIGTLWWFDIFDAKEKQKEEIKKKITSHIEKFEKNYSRFLPSSYIGQLNTKGELEHPTKELISLLTYGQKLYTDTNGVFNFLSAHTQVANGYGSTETIQDTQNEEPSDPNTDLIIGEKKIILKQGAVDLGGFGKGWLIDDLAEMLKKSLNLHHFLINGGGDIYATNNTDNSPIEIFVEHPTKPDYVIAKLPLNNQGFGSSSTHKRQWKKDGKKQDHIIRDHKDAMAVHVISNDALTSDVFATIVCASKPKEATKILENNNLKDYLIISDEGVICSKGFEKYLLTSN